MSLDGKSFFYVNPLEVIPEASLKDRTRRHVKIERQKWFACACCPPNLARIIASLGSYVHSANADTLYTHLFLGSEATVKVAGKEVKVGIETSYPWEGHVAVSFNLEGKAQFTYGIRIPGWCNKFTLTLNGVAASYTLKDGYALINREWSDGDRIALALDMPVALVETNPRARENIGKAAVMRGPVVYCLEEADNGPGLFKLHAGDAKDPKVQYEKDLLEGVVTISFTGKKEKDWPEDTLYRSAAELAAEAKNRGSPLEDKELRWIPYYAWANRKPGEMTVWVNK
jgi:DUF1680 family protein